MTSPALEPLVLCEVRGRVAIVTLNRPARMNALSRDTLLEIGRLGRELASREGVLACVVTGAGDRAFCAGADLKERAGMSDDDVRAQLLLYRSELAWLGESPFLTVAAINGAALGGGLELALACDLRVAAPTVELGLPETGLAIIPAAGGTQRLPRVVGTSKALELITLGRRIGAEEAYAIGLVNRVSTAGTDVLEDTLAWLAPVASGAPIAQRAALSAVRASLDLPLREGLELERKAYEACLTSEDRREALAAFAAKRKPTFQGR
jgi:enoyl-CoA hydratase/carnithine racemase